MMNINSSSIQSNVPEWFAWEAVGNNCVSGASESLEIFLTKSWSKVAQQKLRRNICISELLVIVYQSEELNKILQITRKAKSDQTGKPSLTYTQQQQSAVCLCADSEVRDVAAGHPPQLPLTRTAAVLTRWQSKEYAQYSVTMHHALLHILNNLVFSLIHFYCCEMSRFCLINRITCSGRYTA